MLYAIRLLGLYNISMIMKKNKKSILAITGIVLLIGMYIFTLVCAIIKTPFAKSLFMASLYCTIVIPVFIYIFMMVTKYLKGRGIKDDDDTSSKE